MTRYMAIVLATLLVCVLAIACLLLYWSPGTLRPILDPQGESFPNSLSEKIFVAVNGVNQGLILRSSDTSNPVLLYVHGGPGMPTYFLEQAYPTSLESDFIIAWWDQRGAGLSYSADIAPETITVQQLITDTITVTDYLRDRFGKKRIYLMGHSWGSFIGVQAAARAPERFHAYIGVAQMTNQLKSERIAYKYMLNEFHAKGNSAMVEKLEAIPSELTAPLPQSYMALRDNAMHALGIGTTKEMRCVVRGVFFSIWQNPEYTLREKTNIWRGKWSMNSRQLWNEMLAVDITAEVPRLEIPVYLLHGKHDYTVSYDLAKTYLQQLDAPLKGFYSYEHSAHSPIFEEPGRTRTILETDVLSNAASLSDPLR